LTEEIEIAGSELVERVKAIAAEGKVSRLKIKAADGEVYLEMPLPLGAVAGGALVIAAPWLAVIGVLAALATRVKVEVTRIEPTTEASNPEKPDEAA
jgi:hypothetical protein